MRLMKRNFGSICIFLLLLSCLLNLQGCAAKHPSHPNQINAMDGGVYDTLLVAQTALAQSKTELDEVKIEFSKTTFPSPEAKERARKHVNSLGDLYNTGAKVYNQALADYALWRNIQSGAAKGDLPAIQASLSNDINSLLASIAAFRKQTGGSL